MTLLDYVFTLKDGTLKGKSAIILTSRDNRFKRDITIFLNRGINNETNTTTAVLNTIPSNVRGNALALVPPPPPKVYNSERRRDGAPSTPGAALFHLITCLLIISLTLWKI